MMFTIPISLEEFGKLTKIYAKLVGLLPVHHDDSIMGFANWCVKSGYAHADITITAEEIARFMERKK